MKTLALLCAVLLMAPAARADWREELSPEAPGGFPPLRTLRLEYDCGWSGLTAGHVAATFSHATANVEDLDVKGGTVGFARALWRLDATHEARAGLLTLRPISVDQREVYRYQTIRTELKFDDTGVEHLRESTNDKKPGKWKRYDFPGLFDLQTAILYVRSQKLLAGQVYKFVVYPATTPYLATVTVLARERLRVKAGLYPAIKLDLRLQKINGEMRLEPHGKFKRATGWISDDADRLPLRLNAQIFVGSVWAELITVR